ncbi:hypothetical protein [Methylorubrum extorquens]|uniref:hypothetical protein n=1 Tax=Methylorubrum extorquens TaxID=408 RepID=UPI0005A516CB|nr:hypothetical protein [Methylorubrum extorquens]
MLPIADDMASNLANVPALLDAVDLAHNEAAAGLTAELLQTTSVSALELPLVGAAERDDPAAAGVARNEGGSVGDAELEARLTEASTTVSELAEVDQPAAEVAHKSLPMATPPTSLHEEQPRPAKVLQRHALSHTLHLAPLTFTQIALQMNVAAWAYAHSENGAALTYLRALSRARTPPQVIDLQTRAMTRALDAAARLGEALAALTQQLLTGSGLQRTAAT